MASMDGGAPFEFDANALDTPLWMGALHAREHGRHSERTSPRAINMND